MSVHCAAGLGLLAEQTTTIDDECQYAEPNDAPDARLDYVLHSRSVVGLFYVSLVLASEHAQCDDPEHQYHPKQDQVGTDTQIEPIKATRGSEDT